MKSQIEILLGEWGRWKRGENRSVLGYPRKAAFMVMRVDGGNCTAPLGFVSDKEVERLDAEVSAIHPEYRVTLAAHYIWPGTIKEKLGRLSISRALYYFRLEFATKQLSFQMGFIEKIAKNNPVHDPGFDLGFRKE